MQRDRKKKTASQELFGEAANGGKEKTANKPKMRRSVRYGIIALAVCLLIAFVAANYKNLAPDRVGEWFGEGFAGMGTGKGYPYEINSNSVLQFEKMNKDIAVLTDTSVVVLNSSARELVNRVHGYSNPVMDTSDNRLLIYDLGGKRLRIENRSKVLFESTMQQNIITADISQDGSFAVATQSATSSCELKVYSHNFNEVLTWYSSGDHIISVAMAPNGKSVAVAAVGAQGGEMKSTVYILNFNKEEPVAQIDYLSTVILSLDYTSKNAVIAAGDSMLSIIGSDGSVIQDISYSGSSLKRSVMNTQKGAAAVYSMYDSGNLNEAVMIAEDGKVCYRAEIRRDVRCADHSSERIYTACGSELYWFNEKGEQQPAVNIGADCSKIAAFGNHVYVLGMNEIRHYNLLDSPTQAEGISES